MLFWLILLSPVNPRLISVTVILPVLIYQIVVQSLSCLRMTLFSFVICLIFICSFDVGHGG